MDTNTSNSTETDGFLSSLHRSVLGALLAIACLIGVGWVLDPAAGGRLLFGVIGVVVAGGAAYWIYDLFLEGLAAR